MSAAVPRPAARETGEVVATIELRRYPPRTLARTFVAALVLFAPLYAVMLLLASSTAGRLAVLALIGGTLLVALWLGQRATRCRLTLRSGGITEHGLLAPERFVPADLVAQAVVVPVYDTTLAVGTQLFLVDASGRTLLRMSGWDDHSVDTVAAHFGVPMVHTAEPVTAAQLRQQRPNQLHWIERHPFFERTLFTIAGAAVSIALVQIALFSSR